MTHAHFTNGMHSPEGEHRLLAFAMGPNKTAKEAPKESDIKGAEGDKDLYDTARKNVEHFQREAQNYLRHDFVDEKTKKQLTSKIAKLHDSLNAKLDDNCEGVMLKEREYEGALRQIENLFSRLEGENPDLYDVQPYNERMQQKWEGIALQSGKLVATAYADGKYVLDFPERWKVNIPGKPHDISQSRHRAEFDRADVGPTVRVEIPGKKPYDAPVTEGSDGGLILDLSGVEDVPSENKADAPKVEQQESELVTIAEDAENLVRDMGKMNRLGDITNMDQEVQQLNVLYAKLVDLSSEGNARNRVDQWISQNGLDGVVKFDGSEYRMQTQTTEAPQAAERAPESELVNISEDTEGLIREMGKMNRLGDITNIEQEVAQLNGLFARFVEASSEGNARNRVDLWLAQNGLDGAVKFDGTEYRYTPEAQNAAAPAAPEQAKETYGQSLEKAKSAYGDFAKALGGIEGPPDYDYANQTLAELNARMGDLQTALEQDSTMGDRAPEQLASDVAGDLPQSVDLPDGRKAAVSFDSSSMEFSWNVAAAPETQEAPMEAMAKETDAALARVRELEGIAEADGYTRDNIQDVVGAIGEYIVAASAEETAILADDYSASDAEMARATDVLRPEITTQMMRRDELTRDYLTDAPPAAPADAREKMPDELAAGPDAGKKPPEAEKKSPKELSEATDKAIMDFLKLIGVELKDVADFDSLDNVDKVNAAIEALQNNPERRRQAAEAIKKVSAAAKAELAGNPALDANRKASLEMIASASTADWVKELEAPDRTAPGRKLGEAGNKGLDKPVQAEFSDKERQEMEKQADDMLAGAKPLEMTQKEIDKLVGRVQMNTGVSVTVNLAANRFDTTPPTTNFEKLLNHISGFVQFITATFDKKVDNETLQQKRDKEAAAKATSPETATETPEQLKQKTDTALSERETARQTYEASSKDSAAKGQLVAALQKAETAINAEIGTVSELEKTDKPRFDRLVELSVNTIPAELRALSELAAAKAPETKEDPEQQKRDAAVALAEAINSLGKGGVAIDANNWQATIDSIVGALNTNEDSLGTKIGLWFNSDGTLEEGEHAWWDFDNDLSYNLAAALRRDPMEGIKRIMRIVPNTVRAENPTAAESLEKIQTVLRVKYPDIDKALAEDEARRKAEIAAMPNDGPMISI